MGMAFLCGMDGGKKLKLLGSLLYEEVLKPLHRLISHIPQVYIPPGIFLLRIEADHNLKKNCARWSSVDHLVRALFLKGRVVFTKKLPGLLFSVSARPVDDITEMYLYLGTAASIFYFDNCHGDSAAVSSPSLP